MTDSISELRAAPEWFPSLQVDSSCIHLNSKWGDQIQPEQTRALFLSHSSDQSGPVIARTPLIPTALVHYLMRNKRDSALATKWLPDTAITNMEGALHTLVTALLKVHIAGDYAYRNGHGVLPFDTAVGALAARQVVLSTAIHPDFEDTQVMYSLCKLAAEPLHGKGLPEDFQIPSTMQKNDDSFRQAYDETLKQHAIYHLTQARSLPSATGPCWSVQDALAAIRQDLGKGPSDSLLIGRVVNVGTHRLSLELLGNIYTASLVNELSALESLCSDGYAYTYDPPSIFAQALDIRLMNLLLTRAFLLVATSNALPALRILAFNDYAAESDIIPLLQAGLARSQKHVQVMSRARLFSGTDGHLDTQLLGTRTALVLHNCSDGFGQNIETEGAHGSMDGAIGVYSSAAAGLRRDRKDLLDFVLQPSEQGRGS